MKQNCLDIGQIQAFLDGECMPESAAAVVRHAADCEACGGVLTEAEEQNAMVFAALDREINTLVPTQRLWMRINDSIAGEKTNSIWSRFLTALGAAFASPGIAAAAALVIVVVAGVFYVGNRADQDPADLRADRRPATPESNLDATALASASGVDDAAAADVFVKRRAVPRSAARPQPVAIRAVYEGDALRSGVKASTAAISAAPQAYLPGEESYLKTISGLKQTVDSQKDQVLTASGRYAYERDMAVVNDSINRMREVVRRDPKNQAAAQVLYAAYQNKVDLLNSVARRDELMASLR